MAVASQTHGDQHEADLSPETRNSGQTGNVATADSHGPRRDTTRARNHPPRMQSLLCLQLESEFLRGFGGVKA